MKILTVFILGLIFSTNCYCQDSNDKDIFYYDKADSLFEIHHWEQAIYYYTKALEFAKPNTDVAFLAYVHRGECRMKLGHFYECFSDSKQAIEIKNVIPKMRSAFLSDKYNNIFYQLAYFNKGYAELNLGNLKDACLDWNKYIEFGDVPKENLEMINNYCK